MSDDSLALEIWNTEEEARAHRAERKRLSENYFNRAHTLAAWLLATLVAVNGGAALTILARIDVAGAAARVSAVAFVLGVTFAILSGFASWWEAQDRSSLHYVESLREDQRSEKGKSKKALWERRVTWLRSIARWVNYASLASFLIGCALSTFFAYG